MYSGLGSNAAGAAKSYDLILISDDVRQFGMLNIIDTITSSVLQVTESEAMILERLFRANDNGKKSSNKSGRKLESLVCVILTNQSTEVPFGTSICASCRIANGRRVSLSEAPTKTLACPRCAIIDNADEHLNPALKAFADFVVYRHIRVRKNKPSFPLLALTNTMLGCNFTSISRNME